MLDRKWAAGGCVPGGWGCGARTLLGQRDPGEATDPLRLSLVPGPAMGKETPVTGLPPALCTQRWDLQREREQGHGVSPGN